MLRNQSSHYGKRLLDVQRKYFNEKLIFEHQQRSGKEIEIFQDK